jgi:hypothetical protein
MDETAVRVRFSDNYGDKLSTELESLAHVLPLSRCRDGHTRAAFWAGRSARPGACGSWCARSIRQWVHGSHRAD